MENYKSCVRKYLINPIEIQIEDKSFDFNSAKETAREKAKAFSPTPILLAWYDGKTGEYVPKAQCGRTDKPGWITYAESRGGTITISFNKEEYVFIFKPYP